MIIKPMRTYSDRSRHPLFLLSLLLLLLGVARNTDALQQNEHVALVDLYPETHRRNEEMRCGSTRRYRLHDLQLTKVYDVKISYLATTPTEFRLQIESILPSDHQSSTTIMGPRRRVLNTAKLRVNPHELLHSSLSSNTDAFRLEWPEESKRIADSGKAISVEISVRPEVEGISPILDLENRMCVFDIIVEEMLFGGAFPFDTLALIVWLVMLFFVTHRWVYPYMLRKLTLILPEDQVGLDNSKES